MSLMCGTVCSIGSGLTPRFSLILTFSHHLEQPSEPCLLKMMVGGERPGNATLPHE